MLYPLRIKTVYLKWATNSPDFSVKTGYGCNKSCFVHSDTANLALVSSSNYLNEKAKVGYFSVISEKTYLAAFNLKLYAFSIALLYTVVLNSVSFNFPSPLEIIISKPNTSLTANS